MSKWQILLIALVLLAGTGYWFAAIPAKAVPSGEESIARFAPGPYKVITESFKAVDETRKTEPNNDFAGRDVRVLKGKVWRPEGLKAPARCWCTATVSCPSTKRACTWCASSPATATPLSLSITR